ncbi:hypothetical protein IGI37_001112 [Enterococcus sp. AZ194]|uniref:hypothetical protein n=1 Tax=Enterococcus sp. AZ194 TaxID=2774629 RepID=UPI003F27E5F6
MLADEIKTRENNLEPYFEKLEFDFFVEKLNQRADIEWLYPVKEAPWGQKCIRFYDLDHHLIEVAENLKSVVERFQTQGYSIEEIALRMAISVKEVNLIIE